LPCLCVGACQDPESSHGEEASAVDVRRTAAVVDSEQIAADLETPHAKQDQSSLQRRLKSPRVHPPQHFLYFFPLPQGQPIVTFAYITGWRIASEVLPLQWRHVDFKSGEIRLDAGTTKNREGRVFKMTDDLRTLLNERQRSTKELERKHGKIIPWVFYRMVAKGRGGEKEPKPIRAFKKAWQIACVGAGCPGRIPHDLRRTAVRNMVRKGVPERVAMKLTGHKTRSVFERYNIVSDGDLDAAALRLNGLMGSKTGSLPESDESSTDSHTAANAS
jgi:integrase